MLAIENLVQLLVCLLRVLGQQVVSHSFEPSLSHEEDAVGGLHMHLFISFILQPEVESGSFDQLSFVRPEG